MKTKTSQKDLPNSSGTGKTGRRYRRSLPSHPARILATSIMTGLSALVRLAQGISSQDPEVIRLVTEITRFWEEAKETSFAHQDEGVADFSHILRIEHNLRKNFLGILWQTTKPYGNIEKRRVYKWSQGTIGPLNILLNYAGALLRSIAMRFFPFPDVPYYQVREFQDGSIKILPRSTARKYPSKDSVKTCWIAAYPGNANHPMVRVRHPTLPEMDFVDMIRAHVVELVRQCFILNVPEKESRKYIRLLVFRLQPYLEWIYTDGKSGKKAFWTGGDKELHCIVHEIRARYGRQVGRFGRLSQQEDEGPEKPPAIKDLVTQLLKTWKLDRSDGMKQDILAFLRLFGFPQDKQKKISVHWRTPEEVQQSIKPLVEAVGYKLKVSDKYRHPPKACLTDADVNDLHLLMSRLAQREGNDWHRVLFGDMFHPFSLQQAIFAGKKYLDTPSDVLIAAEVPVSSGHGRGKADVVVFIGRNIDGKDIWTPFMVLDVKTKIGIDWNLVGKKPRTSKQDARIPKFTTRKRKLTEAEWNHIIMSTPRKNEVTQLKSYEDAIIKEYKSLVTYDNDAPTSLLKGIMLVDPDEDQQEVFTLLPWLVRSVMQQLKDGAVDLQERILYTPHLEGVKKKEQRHLGLVLEPSNTDCSYLKKSLVLDRPIDESPFRDRVKDDGIYFNLYLSVPSGGSSGESAAWIARNWHVLHHLEELRDRSHLPILWFDLAGELGDELLRLQRLRLLGPQSPKRVARRKRESLVRLVEDIEFIDCRNEVEEYLFSDTKKGFDALRIRFLEATKSFVDQKLVLVIDGWDTLKNITPAHRESSLRALEEQFLSWLPKGQVEVIWMDQPVPLPYRSAKYQMHQVEAYPYDSPRRFLLDVITWNLPSSPRNFGWVTPRREDIRVIFQDLPSKHEGMAAPFGVPHLKGWAKRFRAESTKDLKVSTGQLPKSKLYGKGFSSSSDYVRIGEGSLQTIVDDSYQLVPSLSRDSRHIPQGAVRSQPQLTLGLKHLEKQRAQDSIWNRASFERKPVSKHIGRPGIYSPFSEITRGRKRRQILEPQPPSRTTRRPPFVQPTDIDCLDTEEHRLKEIDRIEKIAQFLSERISPHGWNIPGIIKAVTELCGKCQKELAAVDVLDSLPELFRKFDSTLRIWRDLNDARSVYGEVSAVPKNLRSTISDHPELLTRYGSVLFLLLWGVVQEDEERIRSHVITLWKAIADWQWVHMGFPIKTGDKIAHRFDIPALYSNLVWRASILAASSEKVRTPYEHYRFGEMILSEEEPTLWVLLQAHARASQMQIGLLTDVPRGKPLHGTYRTNYELTELGDEAECILEVLDNRVLFVITRYKEKDYLWTKAHTDDERIWVLYGEVRFSSTVIEGIHMLTKLSVWRVPGKIIRELEEPPDLHPPEDLERWSEQALGKVIELGDGSESATVKVRIIEPSQEYCVEVNDSRGNILVKRNFRDTDQLIGFLRAPSRWDFQKTPDGRYYSWNILGDIVYSEQMTHSGKLSLSFLRPRVEMKHFLQGSYPIPRSAREVLATRIGPEVMMLARYDGSPSRKGGWNLWLIGPEVGERLVALQKRDLTVYEVGVLSEVTYLTDPERNVRHPTTFVIDMKRPVNLPREVAERKRIKEFLALKRARKGGAR